MLSQFMVLFGFFALVLVSIFWLNKAVRMFDRLIGDGQPAWVFLEFTALTLPGVIGVVLPIAAFAGAVYVTNRLTTESELTVMQATGYSPWRLIRPVFVYGVIIAVMMSVLTHLLIPVSLSQLRLRQAEVTQNITAKLLTEGEFLHPAQGITFYIRDITPEGELRDVFLSDRRDPSTTVTYTSSKAFLVREGDGTKLVMLDGLSQILRRDGNRLFTTHFDDFSYDISSLISRDEVQLNHIAFTPTPELLLRPEATAERTGTTLGQVAFEGHNRFTQALLCIVAALVGFATLLLGTHSRFGVWWQIVTAFVLLVGIKLIEGFVAAPVLANAALWPLLYIPPVAGALLTVALLHIAVNPGLFRRRRPQTDAGGAA
ncbi:LPS export ABC transporter permease LptF [Roseovarius faecimaris]|uniref:LPS export ABC transporter permease LptF n=1 Tax=Roseovarius faecimaris TaxID=2494550 RepID=A0A6I6IVY6_9RHOB|nr:LPS export ABC transporter permease LptF [Roseovarius faecimaris]QGY00343.1 LPS export ABC transporter permease LptF [Roseovarius faecimaris]